MFKIFTVLSLLSLLAEGGSSQQSSPWAALFAIAVLISLLTFAFFWFRRRYQIIRKMVRARFNDRHPKSPVIGDDAWRKITSGEIARKLIRKEGRQ